MSATQNKETQAKVEKPVVKKEVKKAIKDAVIHTGDYTEVNSVESYDYNDFKELPKAKQNMKNFDTDYKDFVDYIMRITHRIWEQKGIGVIYDTYHNNVTMHLSSTNAVGIDKVIAGTLQTLHGFPDRKLIGQNVVWSNHGKDGYMSSHRILSTATNVNQSEFGPATNKKINFRTVVDCAVENNRIYEEWLVRDNLWIAKQLGVDEHALAKRMAKGSVTNDGINQTQYGIGTNMKGQFFPEKHTAKDDSIGELVKEFISRVYQYRYFSDVLKYYHENAVVHYICDKDLLGHTQIQGMLINLYASFPNAEFITDRITVNGTKEENTYDVSVRWRMNGIHEGIGMFGDPSYKPVEFMGITHYRIRDRKIIEEWFTFDGLDILRQTYLGDEENTTVE